MLDKFYSNKLDMYPLDYEVYLRVMRQHKLALIANSKEHTLDKSLYGPSKYSFYRYFLNIELEAKLWIPTMVASGIDDISSYVDITKPILIPNITKVEAIIDSVK